MPQPVEMILMRQLASYLSIPVWVMDSNGNLIYYNEAAEPVLGRSFELAGPINASEISSLFTTRRADGSDIPNDELPVVIALRERRPAYGPLQFRGLDGTWHDIEVMAFPVQRPDGELAGVVAMFWEKGARP